MNTNTTGGGSSYSQTNVVSIVEQALRNILYGQLRTRNYPVYISDDNKPKAPLPYLEIHGDRAEELVFGPQGAGAGYFRVNVAITYKGHAKETDAPERQAVVDAINYFAYNSPIDLINETENFFCHGFMPSATGDMSVDDGLKAFVYKTTWGIICMPNNNT
jgi:hypothetical protein